MDWKRFPPLVSLRAFEAAARRGGYSAAGRELNVTHAAIAQQVRSLEAFLGLRLAARDGRGIAPTAEGAILAEHLARGLGEIEAGLRRLGAAEATRAVHVTMTPAFAVSWFLPRMALLRAAHPEVELMVNPTADVIELAAQGCDVAIRFGAGGWEGLESEELVASDFVIVAAPELVGANWSGAAADLLDLPWLQELGTMEVARWLAAQGLDMASPPRVTSLPGYMVLAALREGQGVAATARTLVEDDLAAGRLIALHEAGAGPPTAYHLVWRAGHQRPALATFLAWIRRTARGVDSPVASPIPSS